MLNFRMRKFFARLLTPFLTVWMCWMPSQSYGFVAPPAQLAIYGLPTAGAAASAAGGGAAAAGGIALLGAASIGLGASISYFAIDYLVGDAYDTARIPLTSGSPVPSPTAPATSAGVPTIIYKMGNGFGATPLGSTPDEVCSGQGGSVSGSTCYGVPQAQCTTLGYSGCSSSNNLPIGSDNTLGCSPGYSMSGQSCVLTNAREATPDHACDYSNSGSALAQISDSDCGSLSSGIDCSTGVCIITSLNDLGQPRRTVITPRPDGGSTFEDYQQRPINNTTVVDHTIIGISPGGTVDSITGGTTTGTVPTDGSAPAPGQDVSPIDITFPSDYARIGEAQTAINTIAPDVHTMADALSVTSSVADPVVPGAAELPTFGNAFDGVTGWSLPAHSSACPTPSVDLSSVLGAGNVFTMSAHCDLINEHFGIFQAASLVVWSLMALFIVLRA